jgi:hypothetical protein
MDNFSSLIENNFKFWKKKFSHYIILLRFLKERKTFLVKKMHVSFNFYLKKKCRFLLLIKEDPNFKIIHHPHLVILGFREKEWNNSPSQ